MKNINKIIAFVGLAVACVSCNDFLSTDMPSYVEPDNFYGSKTEVDMAIAGIYGELNSFGGYGKNLSVLLDAGADEYNYNRAENNNWTVGLYVYTASDSDVEKTWTSLYSTINLANTFLENLQTDKFSEEAANAYLGEVRFIRALSYMNLTFYWGEVPLRTKSTDEISDNHKAAASLEEIYQFIADDLLFAAEHLPHAKSSGYVPGRANSMAARGLLARLYLKKAGYPLQDFSGYAQAKEQLDIIINDGYHSLVTVPSSTVISEKNNGYRDLFMGYIGGKFYTTESLFEITYAYDASLGIKMSGSIGALNGLVCSAKDGPEAYAMANATVYLDNMYAEGDMRHLWNVPGMQYNGTNVTDVTKFKGTFAPGKYRRWDPVLTQAEAMDADCKDYGTDKWNGNEPDEVDYLEDVDSFNKNSTSINFPVLRYADVLLMSVEAEYFLNGKNATQVCYDRLNEVRRRAGLEDLALGTLSAGSANFFDEIVFERMRELCFEGLRTNDLRRWGLLERQLTASKNAIESDALYDSADANIMSLLRAQKNYLSNPAKYEYLPYPYTEVVLNNKLDQKPLW